MKAVLILLLASGLLIVAWLKNKPISSLDDVIKKTIEYQDRIHSYSITIEDFDARGFKRADIEYMITGDDWVMKSATTNDTIFEWRKIGDDLYVRNADTRWFWRVPNSSQLLPRRVDVREAMQEVQQGIEKKILRVTRVGSEPCGSHLCFRYQLVDPSFSISERYWFVDASEYRIVRDQFVIGNGETSITTYDYEKEISIEKPKMIRDIATGMDDLSLPGVIKNLAPPSVQQRVLADDGRYP